MLDRRSLIGAFAKSAAVATSTASANVAVHSAERRSLQKKVDEVASLADQLEIEDFDDVAFAARLAFDHANTANGRGTTFRVPPRVMVMKAPLRVPNRIVLCGSGMRDTIFQAQHDGPMFLFQDVEHAGLSNVRLGLGSRPTTQGIRIETKDASARRLTFADLDIAGGGQAAAGQTGVTIVARGKQIVSECTFDRLILSEIDCPVVERGPEGNEWTRFVVDNFGYGGGAAFDSIAHASHYQGRIAGQPRRGSVAFRQGGYRNIALLRVDIGNGASALDLAPEARNIVFVQRPSESGPPAVQTPLGRVVGNTVIDGDESIMAKGPAIRN